MLCLKTMNALLRMMSCLYLPTHIFIWPWISSATSCPNLNQRTKLTVDDFMELVKFTLTTSYFSSKGIIYQQVKGAAMGSPLSPIAVVLYMEWLESQAIATAPLNCTPKLWKRYVDDILEVIKKGETGNLTAHLNHIDPRGALSLHMRKRKEEVSLS